MAVRFASLVQTLAELVSALETLPGAPAEQERISATARRATESEFNPDNIQAQFREIIESIIDARNA